MNDQTHEAKIFYHINDCPDIKPLDIGHGIDETWDVTDNYPYYCLNFLLSSETVLEIDKESYTVSPNQLFLIPPNTPVRYYSTKGPIEVYWINFYGRQCKQLVELTNFSKSPVLSLPGQLRQKILSDFKETLLLCEHTNIQGLACNQLLFNIFKVLMTSCKLYESASSTERKTDFDNIMQLINANLFNTKLNAKFICNLCYLTPEHLSRIFKKNLNMHFSSYVNNERIKKASVILVDTDYTLTKIASMVGYTDVYYFCKVFKKYRLMTPTQYRLLHASEAK